MTRQELEQMYIDVHGGEPYVNKKLLSATSDEEITTIITAYAKLGKSVGDGYINCSGTILRSIVSAAKRLKETEQENSHAE